MRWWFETNLFKRDRKFETWDVYKSSTYYPLKYWTKYYFNVFFLFCFQHMELACQNVVDKVVWVAKKVLVLNCSVTWNIVDVTKGKAKGNQKGGMWDTCPKLGGMFWCPDKTEHAPRTRNIPSFLYSHRDACTCGHPPRVPISSPSPYTCPRPFPLTPGSDK